MKTHQEELYVLEKKTHQVLRFKRERELTECAFQNMTTYQVADFCAFKAKANLVGVIKTKSKKCAFQK